MLCKKCRQNLNIRIFPFVCRCGTITLANGEVVKGIKIKMSGDTYEKLKKKLKLTPFGVPQEELPEIKRPVPEKPKDLPEDIVQWLNQYSNPANVE